MKVMVIRTNRHLKVEDLRKLHKEICDQLPTRILMLPYDYEYEIVELDATGCETDFDKLQRYMKIGNE